MLKKLCLILCLIGLAPLCQSYDPLKNQKVAKYPNPGKGRQIDIAREVQLRKR